MRIKVQPRIKVPAPPAPQRSGFQIHLSTGLVLMFGGGLLLPYLMQAWTHGGFVMVLLVALNVLILVAVVCEYLIRNTRRRWNDPPAR